MVDSPGRASVTRLALAAAIAMAWLAAGCTSDPHATHVAHGHAAQRSAASLPPNLVAISDRLVTSGQPSAAWLSTLRAQGFDAVVYLAPPDVPDAVADESRIVGSQGLVFVNIPIAFDRPTPADYAMFASVMHALEGRKVLVHCQANLRASSMAFLDRAIRRREDPDGAWKAVIAVWKPDGTWQRYIDGELARHGVSFEAY